MVKLYDVMSITKAAIGLCYFKKYGVNSKVPIPGFEDTTFFQALNHTSKYSEACWYYNQFRDAVDSNQNLLEYCKKTLQSCGTTKPKQPDNTYLWEYNDLMYQVLACSMKDLVETFARIMGDRFISDLRKDSDGTYYVEGDGWRWEHTKSGTPLGPHGLEMSEEAAKKLGGMMTHTFKADFPRVEIPPGAWLGIGKDEFKFYCYGWFFSRHTAFAVGYVVQVIAVSPDQVRIQLYDEDWDPNGNFMDNDKNRFKHPRWSFVKTIVEADKKFDDKKYWDNPALSADLSLERGKKVLLKF